MKHTKVPFNGHVIEFLITFYVVDLDFTLCGQSKASDYIVINYMPVKPYMANLPICGTNFKQSYSLISRQNTSFQYNSLLKLLSQGLS